MSQQQLPFAPLTLTELTARHVAAIEDCGYRVSTVLWLRDGWHPEPHDVAHLVTRGTEAREYLAAAQARRGRAVTA